MLRHAGAEFRETDVAHWLGPNLSQAYIDTYIREKRKTVRTVRERR